MRELSLLYFAPAFSESDDVAIMKLLRKISAKHKNFKIEILNTTGRKIQESLYDNYFKNPKVAQLIRRRVGRSPSKLFRTFSNSNHIYLSGVVAIEENGEVQWAQKPPHSYELLKDIVNRGTDTLDDLYLYSDTLKDEEQDLLDVFEDSELLKGRMERNFRIAQKVSNEFTNLSSKYIDAVVFMPNESAIVIEAEMKLNYTAIGQALTYELWFRIQENCLKTLPAIICAHSSPEYEFVCKNLGIAVVRVDQGMVNVITGGSSFDTD